MTQALQRHDLERLVRGMLADQVEGLSETLGPHDDLQLAGVKSMDLLVVLSRLERDLGVALDDVTIAKGHTIQRIVDQLCTLVPARAAEATGD